MQLFPTPAPSFDAPFEMLAACHDKVREFCTLLEKLPAWIAAHGRDAEAQNAARAILRYFDLAGPQHHLDEEQELFPLIAARQLDQQRVIEELCAEHQALQQHWQALREWLVPLAAGEPGPAQHPELARFVACYRSHAAREERWLFPLAQQLMSEAEQLAAGQRMAARRHS